MPAIAEKILAKKVKGKRRVEPGEIIEAEVDYIMLNDVTGLPAFKVFYKLSEQLEKEGLKKSELKPTGEKVVLIPDHYVPNKDIASAEQAKAMREFARKYKIGNYFEIGNGGVCHQVMIEEGFAAPGKLVVGADSHSCTYGALGAFGTGVGSTEAACAMLTGELWFKVPESYKFVVNGKLGKNVMGKDVILHIIGDIGVNGANYKSMEFYGSAISALPLADRITIANMGIEAGAKAAIIPPDKKVFDYLKNRSRGSYEAVYADKGASYEKGFEYDASEILPTVAKPFSPANTSPAGELGNIEIDQAYLGSCTNGRIEDLRATLKIMKGRKVHKNVRMIVVPASKRVYMQALKEGLIEKFMQAGAYVSGPTCGACLGGYMGVLASKEVCISTTNRNFIGRMGHSTSEVYLASPAVVAASAVAGRITDPNNLKY